MYNHPTANDLKYAEENGLDTTGENAQWSTGRDVFLVKKSPRG
jgi:hypothetical protein